jgi:VanZ family protein
LIVLSTLPQSGPPKSVYTDKLLHLGAYAILTFILHLAFNSQCKISLLQKHSLIFASLIAISFGFFIEINQLLVPTRSFNKYDLLANVLGSIFMILLIKIGEKILKVIKVEA